MPAMPPTDFTKMVPGFDFLQGLMKNAGAGLPNMSQWIAPTLDPEEIDKRIQELRAVQFWLEQNAKMLSASIQALEVQRMSLATLKAMNLPMTEVRDALKIKPAAPKPAPEPPAEPPAPPKAARKAAAPKAPADDAAAASAVVDPMQWWGALTRQFTELAANAIKEMPVDAARQMAAAAMTQAVPAADKPAAAPRRKRG